jgi:hypothetical protein
MFNEFKLGAKNSKDCDAACNHNYMLQARYLTAVWITYSVYSIEDEVIVTSMKHYYQNIDILKEDEYRQVKAEFHGSVFAGVSFRDSIDHIVESIKH